VTDPSITPEPTNRELWEMAGFSFGVGPASPYDNSRWAVKSTGLRAVFNAGRNAADIAASESGDTAWDRAVARAGVATHNTVSREQIAEAIAERGSDYGYGVNVIDPWDAADAVLALLVPTSKETSE
jgi:hypothetical protein